MLFRSASYRGYFGEADAQAHADSLAAQGMDVYVGGVAAYSTLGWLNDPVLSTFIHRDEPRLADLVFHELAHQVLYVADDTVFNESFATAVAREGVRRWMESRRDSEGYQRYQRYKSQQGEFVDLITDLRTRLVPVYDSAADSEQKRERKRDEIARMRNEYEALKQFWGGDDVYDNWIYSEINNAKLNSVSAYHDLVPAFTRMLKQSQSLEEFYQRCRELAEADAEERLRQLTRFQHPTLANQEG